jgi:succinyl-diaminopimelate desuccinylase
VNAIKLALEGLQPVLESGPRDVEIEGLVFREVVSVTELHAGVAANVIPGRAEATINFRYAPDRTAASAAEHIRELLPGVEILNNAAGAHVPARARLVERLQAVGEFELQPKQAWTNVADFAARGLDAVNLGPGGTRYAHAVDERVEIAELERCYDSLRRFLSGDAPVPSGA